MQVNIQYMYTDLNLCTRAHLEFILVSFELKARFFFFLIKY